MAGKVTVPEVRSRKRALGGEPLVMLTAYDTPGARIADAGGVDMILVGDSVANTVLGHKDTLAVDVAVMAHHVGAVGRATPRALVVGDLPWLSYHVSAEDTVRNAATLVRAGAEAVKLEGGRARTPMIEAIVGAEIPVMGHLGLTPQSVHAMGGYKVQAKQAAAADALVEDARAIAAAGCFAIVLEGVPDVVAARVTAEVDIPTIGIGAGVGLRRPGPGVPRPARPGHGPGPEVRAPLRRSGHVGRRGGVGLGRRRAYGGLPGRRRDLPPPRRGRPRGTLTHPSGTMTAGSPRPPAGTGLLEPCSAMVEPRSPRARVQREVSRACGRTKRW